MSQNQSAARSTMPQSGTVEANKAVVRRWIEEGWNRRNLGSIAELYAANVVQHDPNGPPVTSAAALKDYIAAYQVAFPDLKFSIESLVGEGDRVVWRFMSHGTHKGALMGLPPTGKQGDVAGMVEFRLAEGRIAEVWVNLDALGLFQQLGVIPTLG
jgi:steroid delta-isomerase-like uncharacterized protein